MRGTWAWPPTGLIPWFSKTEGNTCATLLHHPFLFKGKPTQCSRGSKKDFWRRCQGAHTKSSKDLTPANVRFLAPLPGSLRTSQDIPSTHHKLSSLTLHYFPFASRLPLVFLSPTSKTIFKDFPSLRPSSVRLIRLVFVCLCVGLLALSRWPYLILVIFTLKG